MVRTQFLICKEPAIQTLSQSLYCFFYNQTSKLVLESNLSRFFANHTSGEAISRQQDVQCQNLTGTKMWHSRIWALWRYAEFAEYSYTRFYLCSPFYWNCTSCRDISTFGFYNIRYCCSIFIVACCHSVHVLCIKFSWNHKQCSWFYENLSNIT